MDFQLFWWQNAISKQLSGSIGQITSFIGFPDLIHAFFESLRKCQTRFPSTVSQVYRLRLISYVISCGQFLKSTAALINENFDKRIHSIRLFGRKEAHKSLAFNLRLTFNSAISNHKPESQQQPVGSQFSNKLQQLFEIPDSNWLDLYRLNRILPK